ncbi:MAG: hypothetical protein ACRDGF_07725 [Chloroflexota bacterium]
MPRALRVGLAAAGYFLLYLFLSILSIIVVVAMYGQQPSGSVPATAGLTCALLVTFLLWRLRHRHRRQKPDEGTLPSEPGSTSPPGACIMRTTEDTSGDRRGPPQTQRGRRARH